HTWGGSGSACAFRGPHTCPATRILRSLVPRGVMPGQSSRLVARADLPVHGGRRSDEPRQRRHDGPPHQDLEPLLASRPRHVPSVIGFALLRPESWFSSLSLRPVCTYTLSHV